MVYDVVREYPDLGSFLYGHWESIELGTAAFLILCGVLLIGLLTTLACGVIGYVLQSVALYKIAKRYGAGKQLRTKACLPFVRYFAIGKMAERCDVVSGAQKRRLWGRILVITCSIMVPIAVLMLILGGLGFFGTQFFAMLSESSGSIFDDANGVVEIVTGVLYILFLVPALPFLLLLLFETETFALLMVVLPFIGLACLLVGTLLVAAVRTLSGVCYYKILRGYFPDKSALLLTVGGAVTGWTPVVLFIASRKKQ